MKTPVPFLFLFNCSVLLSSSLHAQTFTGQKAFAESPVSLRAVVFPVPGQPVVRIHFDRFSRGAVLIRIKNDRNRLLYEEYVYERKFAGRFDVADLPAGLYTVELSMSAARYTQHIRIESPAERRVVMVNAPVRLEGRLASH